ncbi:hypothetical protein [Candidatus Poriferisodalis sp.]|uniref:hypothetical protein n=1 Tax=Candidatus Poriferisodalis sp. TaxID=3101277 RepID=UPI003B01CD08
MISLQDAIDSLYEIAVTEDKPTSTKRLEVLAAMCIEQLGLRGIADAMAELAVPGIGRSKKWDVGWPATGKVRLGISLKSLLSNISGTVPNRVDDLAGEVANVQLLSPEIVTGYLVVFHVGNGMRQDGTRWVDFFREAIERLSGRDAPAWATGMVEASALVEVDFSNGPVVVDAPDMDGFFDRLAICVQDRNPDMF